MTQEGSMQATNIKSNTAIESMDKTMIRHNDALRNLRNRINSVLERLDGPITSTQTSEEIPIATGELTSLSNAIDEYGFLTSDFVNITDKLERL